MKLFIAASKLASSSGPQLPAPHRIRPPGLRKSTAVSEETMDEETGSPNADNPTPSDSSAVALSSNLSIHTTTLTATSSSYVNSIGGVTSSWDGSNLVVGGQRGIPASNLMAAVLATSSGTSLGRRQVSPSAINLANSQSCSSPSSSASTQQSLLSISPQIPQPTATIHCTKSEPLAGDDTLPGSNPTLHHAHHHSNRSVSTVHANSVPQMKISKLHDLAAMSTVRSCDAILTDDAASSSLFEPAHSSARHQVSTDSSSSTNSTSSRDTGVTLPLNSQLMPPKAVIQDDIRMKLGRFELVKKKGRSEVWNLFGQVLDTTTGARLPYVACYACKVLYTDTGGGTGNMTRHRCPLGTSYKDSSIGSSTETNPDLSSQQSFETAVSAGGQLSPEAASGYQRESPAPGQSHVSLTAQSSFESSPPFSDFDRRLFCAAVVRCCATDLLPPVVFQDRRDLINCENLHAKCVGARDWARCQIPGDGLRSVIETAIAIGRRCRLADRQSLSTLIPDTLTLQQLIDNSSKSVLSELKLEVGCTARATGLSLSVEGVTGDDRLAVVSANYVGADWRLKRRIISVERRDQLQNGMDQIIGECASGALHLTIVTEQPLLNFDSSARTSICICATLNNIVDEIFTDATDEKHNVAEVISSCQKMASTFEKMGLERRTEVICESRCGHIDYLFYVYELLKFVREYVIALIHPIEWSFVDDIRRYLEPFHVMASIFSQKAVINYHMVLPEWFALIHEFSGEDEDSSAANFETSSANSSQSSCSSSKWLSSVRKATEDKLRSLTSSTISVEHRMATVLNPRLKHLPVICNDLQRIEAYTKIRSMIGLWETRAIVPRSEDPIGSEAVEGEPPRKRISFLSSLEDRAMIDDELECYLRSQFPAIQTKDVLQFWSTLGQSQFPNLAHLARYLLSIPSACCQHRSQSNVTLPTDSLTSLLILRSSYAHATHLPDAFSISTSVLSAAKSTASSTSKVDS
ncbi:unnamed protein product [Anisakis simplex]|uniref:BED-type domain-containing protein n=1 Tax=Anisakis simplex TaxID=6269 RepID=A0A158PPM9_ANISI|nr:unnamed protein product [Anisakis simplex]